jgi:CBS domain-containing protein
MTSNPFHNVGSLFPSKVEVITVQPQDKVGKALKIMLERRFSQLPVVENGEALGVFSLWSLARQLSRTANMRLQRSFLDLEVGELLEKVPKVTVKDGLYSILDSLDRFEVLLAESPHGLHCVVTPSDVLRYFWNVARPYILLQEIELALRSLIGIHAPGEKLKTCIDQALTKSYQNRYLPVPTGMEDMNFDDYKSIITCQANWPLFESVLGHNKDLVWTRLDSLRKTRNNTFHFRLDIGISEYEDLVVARDWLFEKVGRRSAEMREKDNG